MSATPRIYEMETDEEFEQEELFGEIVYKMSFNEAINKSYICDYKIWLPSINEDNSKLIKGANKIPVIKRVQSTYSILFEI